MRRAIEASLRRLRTDHVDVFMPHFPDGTTPLEEILAGFDDLVRAGKILHGGLSNFPAWRVAGAVVRADLRGLAPLVGIETEYSLAQRTADREMLPMVEAHGLGALLYSPLAGGLLTGKYRRGDSGRLTGRGDGAETAQQSAVVDAVLTIADETGSSAAQVSLAWLRRRAALAPTALVTIVGPRTPAQLEEYLTSLDLHLDDDQYARLDKVSAGAARRAPRRRRRRPGPRLRWRPHHPGHPARARQLTTDPAVDPAKSALNNPGSFVASYFSALLLYPMAPDDFVAVD